VVIVVDNKLLREGSFALQFSRALFCEGNAQVERLSTIFDDIDFPVIVQHSLVQSENLLETMKSVWTSDIQAVSQKCTDLCPVWAENEKDLVQFDSLVVRTLLLNKQYPFLARLSDTLDNMLSATKAHLGVTLLDPKVVIDAKEASHHTIVTVSVTYALFHLAVAMPKIKSPKLKGSAAEELRAQLGTKGTWAVIPPPLQLFIDAIIAAGKACTN
jgi:hypothetical protein